MDDTSFLHADISNVSDVSVLCNNISHLYCVSLQKSFLFMFQTESVYAPFHYPASKQKCSLPLFQYGKLIFCVSASMNKCVPQGKIAGLHA